jgi:hypothetical protein
MKKQELIEKLKAAGTLSSSAFIPVSDVIKMVEDLETESSSELSDDLDFISDVTKEIFYQLERSGRDLINDFEIDTDVSGNTVEISISDVSFNSYEIEEIVDDAFEKIKAKKEEYKQEENNQ